MLCGLHTNVLMSSHCEDYVFQMLFLSNKNISGSATNVIPSLSCILTCYTAVAIQQSLHIPCTGTQPKQGLWVIQDVWIIKNLKQQ